MSAARQVSPDEALDGIFTVIREEALANPRFARRLLDAAGVRVAFSGPEALAAADPVIAAAHHDYASFLLMFSTFSEPDLKKMATASGLATAEDVKSVPRPKKAGYIDLMWRGAKHKLKDMG